MTTLQLLASSDQELLSFGIITLLDEVGNLLQLLKGLVRAAEDELFEDCLQMGVEVCAS